MAVQVHTEAALNAIATALLAFLDASTAIPGTGTVAVRVGWPDSQTDRPTTKAYVAVVAGDPVETAIPPRVESQTITPGAGDDPDTAIVVYQTGRWECPIQLDVFAQTKLLRNELATIVGGWLATVPFDGARQVTSTGYFNDPVRVTRVGASAGDGDSPLAGEWRYTFTATAKGKILHQTATPLVVLARADVELELNDVSTEFTVPTPE